MKKINYNHNENKDGVQTNNSKKVIIAHFEAGELLRIWFVSFLFLLFLIIGGFASFGYWILNHHA